METEWGRRYRVVEQASPECDKGTAFRSTVDSGQDRHQQHEFHSDPADAKLGADGCLNQCRRQEDHQDP